MLKNCCRLTCLLLHQAGDWLQTPAYKTGLQAFQHDGSGFRFSFCFSMMECCIRCSSSVAQLLIHYTYAKDIVVVRIHTATAFQDSRLQCSLARKAAALKIYVLFKQCSSNMSIEASRTPTSSFQFKLLSICALYQEGAVIVVQGSSAVLVCVLF